MINFEPLTNAQKQEIQDNTFSGSNKMHTIPFVLPTDGEARVADFFDVKTKTEQLEPGKTVLANSFHGRALKGRELNLPKDVVGVVYERKAEKTVIYQPKGVFKNLTYWKHDDLPMNADKVALIGKYAQVFTELHQD